MAPGALEQQRLRAQALQAQANPFLNQASTSELWNWMGQVGTYGSATVTLTSSSASEARSGGLKKPTSQTEPTIGNENKRWLDKDLQQTLKAGRSLLG